MADDLLPDPDCIHCVLGSALIKMSETHQFTAVEVAHDLGQIIRDILAGHGIIDMKAAPPNVIGPILTAFMKGIGLQTCEHEVEDEPVGRPTCH